MPFITVDTSIASALACFLYLDAQRKQAGCRGVRRFRNVNDPDELIVIFDWDTHENARRFVEMKVTENARLVEERSPGGPPKLENLYVEEMEPLPS